MTTAKFSGAAKLALADVGGPMSGIPFNEWTANGATTAGAVAPFSLVVNEAIDATVPASGKLTTANGEVLHYSAYVAGTKTFTIDARAQENTTAAAIDNGSAVGQWLTRDQWNQIVDEIIALETQAQGGIHNPNLVLNSDFGRRTVFGLAMPEAFADTSGFTVALGTVGSVASNLWTMGTVAQTRAIWGMTVWRDIRVSAQFKATDAAAAGVTDRIWTRYVDANNGIWAECNNGNFNLKKQVAGTPTTVATVAQALTTNNYYWLEIEMQGTTAIAKLYSSGAAAAAKSSATLLQTLTGTVADAELVAGQVGVDSIHTTNAGQWGGMAASPGGVYVETWLPESLGSITFTGGGMALGYDDAADSGPLGKQWALMAYVPATSRTLTGDFSIPVIPASTAHALSQYVKNTSLGGSGVMARLSLIEKNTAGATQATTNVDDAAETAWTRKSGTVTTNASTTNGTVRISINPATTRTGTVRLSLAQLEQGSIVTAWRNAPADNGSGFGWLLEKDADTSLGSVGAFADTDARDYAVNAFLPFDATVDIGFVGCLDGNIANLTVTVDGTAEKQIDVGLSNGGNRTSVSYMVRKRLAAGKHRIALQWKTTAITPTIKGRTSGYSSVLTVTAMRGK